MGKGRPYTLWILLGAGVLTIGLHWIPFGTMALYPFLLFSTYAHELGHAIAAWQCNMDVQGVSMWTDGAGVAKYTGSPTGMQRATILAGGLLGPSIIALLCLWLGLSTRLARGALFVFGVLAIGSAVLLMENTFGRTFAAGFGVIAIFIAFKTPEAFAQFTLLFVALQLALSVFSRSDYLFMESVTHGTEKMPSDVAAMATALGGPYWLWGSLVGFWSVLVLVLGFLPHVLRKRTAGQSTAATSAQQAQ